MAVTNPSTSGRNLTPSSTPSASPALARPGAASPKRVHGQGALPPSGERCPTSGALPAATTASGSAPAATAADSAARKTSTANLKARAMARSNVVGSPFDVIGLPMGKGHTGPRAGRGWEIRP
jgi:hypothetical protein